MSLGTSIFLSAALLGVIALYIATKDRWNWKKIILWPVLTIIGLSILGGIGLYIYSKMSEWPSVQNSFWDIPLHSTKEDVKYLKGVPTNKKHGDDNWIYKVKGYLERESVFWVTFKDDKIRYVLCWGDRSTYLQGIGVGSNYSSITNKFGKPSFVSRSGDELARLLSFEKYNVIFMVEENEVIAYGMYNPRFGPLKIGQWKKHKPRTEK